MITARQLGLAQHYLSRAIAGLSSLCVLSVFLYALCLMLAVHHTAQRSALQKQIDQKTLALAELQAAYLGATEAISPARAQELGYVQPTSVTAVFVGGGAQALSLQ